MYDQNRELYYNLFQELIYFETNNVPTSLDCVCLQFQFLPQCHLKVLAETAT